MTATVINILVLNAGSSSLKTCLYQLDRNGAWPDLPLQPIWSGFADWGHYPDRAELKVTAYPTGLNADSQPVTLAWTLADPTLASVLIAFFETLWSGQTQVIPDLVAIDIVGHRVVHGGPHFSQPQRITPQVKAEIAAAIPFAPLHNPANLRGITMVEELLGDVPQVAVFDTAFHRQMPVVAKVYPLPYPLYEAGIQRYGFHGISHGYVSQRAAALLHQDLANLRLITCHLGNGSSLAAVKAGTCVATTMGFTPTAGLMMGTRCGDLDPGILVYLFRQGYTADELDHLINRESGLVGVSGVSSDLREVLSACAAGNIQAQLAYDLFIYRLQTQIASLIPALGGLDGLVFTAGIGENSAQVRWDVCRGLAWLGVELAPELNQHSGLEQDIATATAPIRALVIHTQEDWAIAGACWLNQSLQKS